MVNFGLHPAILAGDNWLCKSNGLGDIINSTPVVVGTPHPRWGQQVTALVKLCKGAQASEDELRGAAEAHIARYKLPRAFLFVDRVLRSPSGKADYRWAKRKAEEAL